ncbi:hypothetical protein D3C85_937890 [compost metagenome]
MGGRFTFHRRVGSQDHFGKAALLFDSRHQLRNANGFRAQAIQRRQMPLEHEVAAAITGLLNGIDVHRTFHHAQQGVVTPQVGALRAQFLLGQGPALAAVPDALHGLVQGLGQTSPPTAITLK